MDITESAKPVVLAERDLLCGPGRTMTSVISLVPVTVAMEVGKPGPVASRS